jgi:hypothetical protein
MAGAKPLRTRYTPDFHRHVEVNFGRPVREIQPRESIFERDWIRL